MTEGRQLLFSVKEKSKSNFPLFSKLFPLMSAVVVLYCTFTCEGSVTQVFQMAEGLKKKSLKREVFITLTSWNDFYKG